MSETYFTCIQHVHSMPLCHMARLKINYISPISPVIRQFALIHSINLHFFPLLKSFWLLLAPFYDNSLQIFYLITHLHLQYAQASVSKYGTPKTHTKPTRLAIYFLKTRVNSVEPLHTVRMAVIWHGLMVPSKS